MSAIDLAVELFLHDKWYWIVGETYDLADKEFRVIWDTLMIKLGFLTDKRIKRAYNKKQGEMYIKFPWGTMLEVKSAAHPETLVGEGLDGVIMSEAAKHTEETWSRFIRASLADKRGWATFPTTPEGMNWVYDLWQMGRNPEYAGLYESWNFPSWDNRVVFPGGRHDPEILLLEATMSVEEFLQEIAAQFTSFRGRIYHEFEEKTHVQEVKFNPAWPNYGTFDFGWRDPLTFIEFQVTPWDEIRVWREHYVRMQTLEWHLNELKRRPQPEGYRLDLTFGDPADPEAIQVINEKFAPCVGDPLCKTNWRQGVDLVKSFLKLRDTGLFDQYERPIEKPGFIVDHSCKNTIREFNNYRTRDTDLSIRENTAAGAAQKQDDHAMDPIRYALVHLFILGATSHLSDTVDIHEIRRESERALVPESGYFTSDWDM